MLAWWGRAAARWRVAIIACWAVIALAGVVFGGTVYDRTGSVDALRPDAESTVAQARVDRLSPTGEEIVAVIGGRDFHATALVDSATRVMHEIRAIPGVASVHDAYTSPMRRVADDNRSSLVIVELQPGLGDTEALAVAERVAAALHTVEAPEVLVGGELLAERDFGEQAIRDAAIGESAALVVLLIVLVVMLGGVLAGSLPLVGALAAVAATLLALTVLAGAMPISEYAVNVVTLLGIGLTVDYSLLILARFREERAADPRAALAELLARTLSTAGRAVLVSGLAVGAALAGLFAFADPLLAAMALGGALVVALATVTGLTLVPALIAVAHRRLPEPGVRLRLRTGRGRPSRGRPGGPRRGRSGGGRTRPREGYAGLLARSAAFAQRHPVAVALVTTAGLLVLAVPLLHVNLSNSDARSLPADSEARRVYETVERDFSDGLAQPITIVVEAEPGAPAVRVLSDRIRALPGAGDLDVRSDVPPEATVLDLTPAGTTTGEQAQRLVRELRALPSSVPVLVAGPAAELVDAKDSTADRLPIAVLVIVLATALLLFALTGSVVVPAKALAMNVLTLVATLGVLVAVFQWGWAADLLGFQSWGALDLTTPLLLFVFIFGLSMDYEVFLLARIKEEWDRRTSTDCAANDKAVLTGITATGPVVTLAALSIGIVFFGFVFGELVAVKEIGVGMTVAVLLDVTVVRGLLLPAVMSLLGRWNWWPDLRRQGANG